MSSAIGIFLLAAFALGLFILVPFLLAPLVLGAAWLQRRHQLDAGTEEQDQPEAPARQDTSLDDGDPVEEPQEQAVEGRAPVVASTSMLTQAA